MENGHNYVHMDVLPQNLRTDKSYQRDIDKARVARIVKNFNPDLFNEPKVSLRDDGLYYIFDGDHSVMAHIQKFGEATPIKCKVYIGLTKEEEMQLFVQQNGISKNPTNTEKLKARYNYGDHDVVDMVNCANLVGVRIDFVISSGVNKILAVDTAFGVYKKVGRDHFINILDVIKQSWNGDPDSLSQGFLKGLGYIYKNYSSIIRNDKFVAAMKNVPVKAISQRANEFNHDESMEKRFARAFAEKYNVRKKKEFQIIIQ